MNIKKILIIFLFALILANIAIGASYAATEKIHPSTYKEIETFDKSKIVSIDKISVYVKKGVDDSYYKINIKKANKAKYKIQSVTCKYSFWNDDTDKAEIIYKTYDGKNKTSLTIKQPEDYYFLKSMTINYQTKSSIKKESAKLQGSTGTTKVVSYSNKTGKKAKITLTEKGYNINKGQGNRILTYQKFNIKTTNKKYKIKTVQLVYRDIMDKVTKTLTFNGKGKTSLTKTIKGKHNVMADGFLTVIKVTYR